MMTFDSISMWHVLEHVPNTNQNILLNLVRILNKNGKVIIAVPNHSKLGCKLL